MMSETVSQAAWLASIPDDRSISEISIPGTHDSLTWSLTFPSSLIGKYAKTQSLDVDAQLEIGVRYFDIRIDEELKGRHSVAVCRDTLYTSLDSISAFLTEHPSETVIMRLKNENDLDDAEAFDALISSVMEKYSDILWKSDDNAFLPTLGELRGKLMILDNLDGHVVSDVLNTGIRYSNDYLDIEDDYSAPEYETKYSEVIDYIEKYGHDERIRLVHVSATGLEGYNIITSSSPADYADYLNPKVSEYLTSSEVICTGILIFDFIDSDTALNVILQN